MSTSNTVVRVQPPAPPGPASFDRSRFAANASTRMVDTINLILNSDVLNTGRVRAYGDPSNPLLPAIAAPTIATNILFAPGFAANGDPQFRTAVAVSNSLVQVVTSLLVGEPVIPPTIPTWTVVKKGSISVGPSSTLGGQVGNGVLVGPGILYCDGPRPALPASAPILDLDGGNIFGSAPLYT